MRHGLASSMPYALAANFRQRYLNTAFYIRLRGVPTASSAATSTHSRGWGPNILAQNSPALSGFEGSVVDRLRLLYLAERPGTDHVG